METVLCFPSAASQQGKRSSVATTSDSCTDISQVLGLCPGRALHQTGLGSCRLRLVWVLCPARCDGFVEKSRDVAPKELVGLL